MTTIPARRWSADWMSALPPLKRSKLLKSLDKSDARDLLHGWRTWAGDAQLPPTGNWRTWLFLGGRGAGKTRAGAEWIAEGVRRGTMRRVGLVGATFADARSVMIEGEAGLLRATPDADFEPSNRRVLWRNGAVGDVLTAEAPDIIRGHQFDAVWADEFCKWSDPQHALDMLLMALRLGKKPRMVVTTTPRNIIPLKALMTAPGAVMTRSATRDNAINLAPTFFTDLRLRYAGTRLGRQELDAEVIEDNDAALWRRDWIEKTRVREAPRLVRVVVAVDPPASVTGDECGIVTAGLAENGEAYVLGDCSASGLTPACWARRVADAYEDHEADAIVAEANQGGDMVKSLLLEASPNTPVKLVHATRDKRTRAAPAAALYEQGRVHHLGAFPELEDQLCHYDGEGDSPDRLDALVWALAELYPRTRRALPRVRVL
ncbi:MAG: DNA-packaging protein [Alphaproteobacteria bacterium]|nr:DNA-packaging protein [Alphaproteobacteria bacterium]MDE2164245.1 DNA-packaging protein [Alphaproteobacteria bacterium]